MPGLTSPCLADEDDENEEEKYEESILGSDEDKSGSEDEVFDEPVRPKST